MSAESVTTDGDSAWGGSPIQVTVAGTVNGLTTADLSRAFAQAIGVPEDVIVLRKRSGTPRRRKQNDEYAGFIRRSIRGWAQRVGEAGDTTDLPDMLETLRYVQDQIAVAVQGLNDRGFSWQEIGDAVGQRRQHAWRRFHRKDEGWQADSGT